MIGYLIGSKLLFLAVYKSVTNLRPYPKNPTAKNSTVANVAFSSA